MKFPILFFIISVSILTIIDLLCLWIWKREINKIISKKWNIVKTVFFKIIPVVFFIILAYASINIKNISSPDFYYWFMVFVGILLLIYVPKITYIIYYLIAKSIIKIKNAIINSRYSKEQTTIRYPKISRHKFTSQLGIIIATVPFISILFGIFKGRFNFFIKRKTLSFPNLPEAFNKFKIIQISDLHLGSFASNYHRLEGIVDIINAQNADLICFTGDLVNNFYEETLGWDKIFSKLKSKFGTLSILGNHDYGNYSNWKSQTDKIKNFQGIVDSHEKFGWKLLRNQSIKIRIGNDSIVVTGVENWGRPPFPQYGDLYKAMKGTTGFPFKILLSHDPDHWDAQVLKKTNYDLTLSGHTHGMQFGVNLGKIKWSPAKYKFKRWDGLYREGEQYLYVNRGLGFLGMPARIGMPPEITVITLNKTK